MKSQSPFLIEGSNVNNLFTKKRDHHDQVIDFFVKNKNDDSGELDEFIGKTIKQEYLSWTVVLIGLAFATLFLRIYYLQIHQGTSYSLMAEGNRVRQLVVPSVRGIILDANKNLLVKNIPDFSVTLTIADLPLEINKQNELIIELAKLIEKDKQEILDIIAVQKKEGDIYRPIIIKDNLTYEQALRLQIVIKELAGINLDVGQQRKYLAGNSFSHILGYVSKINSEEYKEKKGENYLFNDVIGKTGLEYSYEKELKGNNGVKDVEVDALGKIKKILNVKKPDTGSNLYLTIDGSLQKKVNEILAKTLSDHKKSKASVVILNPQTGAVLSLISTPTYDNNLFVGGIKNDEYQKLINDPERPLYFRAIAGEYPSGSTIKPMWSATALQEGVITPSTSIFSSGGIYVGQWVFPDWKAGGHGATNVRKAIAESVNTFYYYIGGGYDNFKGLGIEKMNQYASLFGLGSESGIDLPGEGTGFFPSPEWKKEKKDEVWYIGDTYHVSIGQGDMLSTPLQVAIWTAFFANNGKIIKPYVVDKIEKSNETLTTQPVVIRENFIDQKNIETVKLGMRDGVLKGSSRRLSTLPIKVSGKTGTAQWNTNKENHAWWTGFAPYDNPEIVITVLVEEGKEGSEIAVPIAKEIFEWWIDEKKNLLISDNDSRI
jgi:penicillin-binding protein 2